MSKLLKLMLVSFTAVGLAAPMATNASELDAMACSVSVDYRLNNISRLTYAKDFEVSAATPFADNFGNAFRFRFFDASMTVEAGIPVVSIVFDADVSVFNAVDFGASLKVRDESNGETISGNNAFFSSVAGAAGAHRTNYTLTCKRAKN
jgi:hypothetical protein